MLFAVPVFWIISGLQLWRQRAGRSLSLKRFQFSAFGTFTLALMLILGTLILVYQTSRISPLLVLVGLLGAAQIFYYLSFLIVSGALFTAWFSILLWNTKHPIRSKIFSGFSLFILLAFTVTLITYNLFPN
jgi:hypothetical protein